MNTSSSAVGPGSDPGRVSGLRRVASRCSTAPCAANVTAATLITRPDDGSRPVASTSATQARSAIRASVTHAADTPCCESSSQVGAIAGMVGQPRPLRRNALCRRVGGKCQTDRMAASHVDVDIARALVSPAPVAVQNAFRALLSKCGRPRRRPVRVDEYGNLVGYRDLVAASEDDPIAGRPSPPMDVDRTAEISDLEGRLAMYKQRCEALADMNAALREALAGKDGPPPVVAHPDSERAHADDSLTWMGTMSRQQFAEVLLAHPVPSLGGAFLPRDAGMSSYPKIRGTHTSIPFWCESDLLAHRFGVLEIAFHKGFCWLTVADYPEADETAALEVQKLLWQQEVRD